MADPFTLLHGTTQQVYINTDQFYYQTTIGSQLGFQGQSQFKVSLLGQYVYAWDQMCFIKGGGSFWIPCDNSPQYSQLYFNSSIYNIDNQAENYTDADYAGYVTSGKVFNASVCVTVAGTKYFCTTQNSEFYSADSVYSNNWNKYQSAAAGTFGMGKNSPIWEIIGSPATKLYDIYMTNFNGWTWAYPTYVAHTQQSVMNLGAFSSEYTTSMPHTTIAPYQGGSYLFALKEFGFGVTNDVSQTQYYESIMNFDAEDSYGFFANKTSFAMNFRGLGLPDKEFNKFSYMLSVLTKGESSCLNKPAGYCVLTNQCSYYQNTGLWNYDFKVAFETQGDVNYIRIPLATFAANSDLDGGLCAIFVEFLDSRLSDDSKFIILGGMFFQSFYLQVTQAGFNAVQMDIYTNLNALPSTYIGSVAYPQGENPFVPVAAMLQPDPDTQMNGLPTFAATIQGITDPAPYFHLDLGASHTMVFTTDCNSTGIGTFPAQSCDMEPVNANNGFDGTPLGTKTGTFSMARFSGYVVSGDIYESKLCFGEFNCKFVSIYATNRVDQDNWHYGGGATYGVLGAGPTSHIWESFIDKDTRQAKLAIELGRVPFYGSYYPSNITFGYATAAPYDGQPNLQVDSLFNFTYALNNISFGRVYQENGVDTSEFFYQLDNWFPVTFNTNFKGIGLPSNIYSDFVSLFEYVTQDEVQCTNTLDGICILPAPCENYTAYNEFSFQLNFTGAENGNYMNIPLGTFAQTFSSGGNLTCHVFVTYLDEYASQSQSVILGGMFMQEFFTIFTNDYNDIQDVHQSATIYVGQNAILNAYVGNQSLPVGVNPFVPQPPAPPSDEGGISTAWIVVLSLLCAILVGFLGFALYKWKLAAMQNARPVASNGEGAPLVNHSGQVTETPSALVEN